MIRKPIFLCLLVASLPMTACRPERNAEEEGSPEEARATVSWPAEATGALESRLENIALRSGPQPDYGEYGQGEYAPGEPIKEEGVEGGVMIGAQFVTDAQYAILKEARFVPFRREMTDAELLESIAPELRRKHRDDLAAIVKEMHERLARVPEMPTDQPEWVQLTPGVVPQGAEAAYKAWFEPDGTLRPRDFLWSQPAPRELSLWAAAYRSTGEEKWARAVVNVMEYYYHHVRPPAEKVAGRISQTRHQWRTLNMGAFTPGYLEAYRAISDWPGLGYVQKVNFLKGAIERAHYLHYTTTPAFPWLKFNPFGYANWLLYQLQGELAIACAFPGLKDAEKWRRHATDGVALQAAWSIQPDGSHDEFSYDYARQVGQQFNWCALTLLRHGYDVPEGLRGNLLRLNEQFTELFCPGDQKPPFGDSHPGRAALRNQARWASVLFLDGRFKHFAEEPQERFLQQMAAILSPAAPESWVRAYKELEARPPDEGRSSSILPDAGWAVLRTGWTAGDNAVALSWRGSDRVAHSGRDHLGINIWAAGKPIAVKLAGTRSYNGEYPAGYALTPRVSNLVLLEDDKGALLPFARVTGALRNWASSAQYDFVDVEHLGWDGGRVKARRRVLYVKPDWLVVIDDHEDLRQAQGGKAAMQWQAHIGTNAPEIRGERAVWQRAGAYGMAWLLGTAPEVEALPVEGGPETFLLKARRELGSGTGLGRWVSVIHFGKGVPPEGLEARAISGTGYEGVRLPTADGERVIIWEPVGDEGLTGRFVCSYKEKVVQFAAADEGALLERVATGPGLERWNGRFFDGTIKAAEETSQGEQSENEEREVREFRRLPWSGQPQLKEEPGVLARFAWEVGAPAVHSLLYRRTGEEGWRRVVAPGRDRQAWLLVPDLQAGATYEVQAVAEWPDGSLTRSAVVSHSF